MNDGTAQPDFAALRRRLGPRRIGDWILFPDLGLLRRGDREVRLDAEALHVLLVLIQAGGGGVARGELLDRVWGEPYPADAVVSRAVADLRAAFGEQAGQEHYLRTLPNFGYQLVPPVGAAELEAARRKPAHGRWTVYGFVIAGLLTAAALAIIWFPPRLLFAPDAPLRLTPGRPLTAAPGMEHTPRLTPDGKWVVYAALREGRQDWDLFRVSLSDGIPQPVATLPGVHEYGPAVAPGGEQVGYVRLGPDGCQVVVQTLVPGVPEPVAECTVKFPTLVDFSPDGRWLAYTTDDVDGRRRLYASDLATGERRRLSHAVSPTGTDFYPRYSPSGRHLAFLRGGPQPDHRSTLWLAYLGVGEERRLTAPPAQIAGLAWLSDSRLLFGVADAGRIEGRVLDLRTGSITPLEGAGLLHPDFAPSGPTLVAARKPTDRDRVPRPADVPGPAVAASTGDDLVVFEGIDLGSE